MAGGVGVLVVAWGVRWAAARWLGAGCLLVLGVLSWLNGGWADDLWSGLHFVPIYLEKVPSG